MTAEKFEKAVELWQRISDLSDVLRGLGSNPQAVESIRVGLLEIKYDDFPELVDAVVGKARTFFARERAKAAIEFEEL